MQTNQVKGIVAYNRIRSKLSKEVKSKGIQLEKGAFNTLSTNIFRHNKGKYIDPILSDISEQIIIERRQEIDTFKMPTALLEEFEYWHFANDYISAGMHEGLYIVSDFIKEPVLATELDYDEDVAPFIRFIDNNRTQDKAPDSDFWFYDYAVFLIFTKPDFNEKTMRLESRLYASKIWSVYNSEQIPYEPGMSGYFDPAELERILTGLKKATIPVMEPEPEKVPEREKRERRDRAAEQKERLLELERETLKEKRLLVEAEEKLAATQERLLDKYTKLYDKGIITEKQFQRKIDKL